MQRNENENEIANEYCAPHFRNEWRSPSFEAFDINAYCLSFELQMNRIDIENICQFARATKWKQKHKQKHNHQPSKKYKKQISINRMEKHEQIKLPNQMRILDECEGLLWNGNGQFDYQEII